MTPHYETPEAVEAELKEAEIILNHSREALREAQKVIKPIHDRFESAWNLVSNLRCRLTTARQKAKAKA